MAERQVAPVGAQQFAKLAVLKKIKFSNLWRARSRLYQNEILQVTMRLTALFDLYKMCTLLHRSKLKILAKHRFEISANNIIS